MRLANNEFLVCPKCKKKILITSKSSNTKIRIAETEENHKCFKAIISSMGRKKIINVPVKSIFKVGNKVKVVKWK